MALPPRLIGGGGRQLGPLEVDLQVNCSRLLDTRDLLPLKDEVHGGHIELFVEEDPHLVRYGAPLVLSCVDVQYVREVLPFLTLPCNIGIGRESSSDEIRKVLETGLGGLSVDDVLYLLLFHWCRGRLACSSK